MKPRVLFVCVENSCRSQMAEGFARWHGEGVIEAWSAGSSPSGEINPTAVQTMKENGIDLNQQASKGLKDLPDVKWDYVFTMGCRDACPFVPSTLKEDWNIPEPKDLPVEEFRKVRDLIEEKVVALINQIKRGNSHVKTVKGRN